MAGHKMNGEAAEFVTQMLPLYVSDEQLHAVGIDRRMPQARAVRGGGLVIETRFVRAHREVDMTNYGDAYRQTRVISPGLDVQVSGSPREVDLVALMLIHEGMLSQLASEQAAYTAETKRLRRSEAAKQERERALLVMYGKLGKKRRANLAASDPQVAALCVRLEEERAEAARIDAMEYS